MIAPTTVENRQKKFLNILETSADEGGYHQISGTLFQQTANPVGEGWLDEKVDAFCCLGVATDVAVRAGVLGWEDKLIQCQTLDEDSVNSSAAVETMGYPPKEVISWFGISPSVMEAMANMNDSGLSFKQIAKLLRRVRNWDTKKRIRHEDLMTAKERSEWN